jgi:hypothetical protein
MSRPTTATNAPQASPSRYCGRAPRPHILTAVRTKVVVTLDPAEVAKLPAINGQPRTTLRVGTEQKNLTAEISTKSLRRTQAAIRELGINAEAGLAATPRIAKGSASSQQGAQGAQDAAPLVALSSPG